MDSSEFGWIRVDVGGIGCIRVGFGSYHVLVFTGLDNKKDKV